MNFSVSYLATLPDFLTWFGMSALMLVLFIGIYTRITPWCEFSLIRQGNTAAAVSLMGTTLAYAWVLAAVIKSSTSRTDMLTWALIGLAVQVVAFLVARVILGKGMRERMAAGDVSVGLVLAGMSLAFGFLNAAVMVPDPTGDIARIIDHISATSAN